MVVVVGTTQCPPLISRHHGPASHVMFPSSSRGVARRHLSSQDAGRGAGVGVGVARVVHHVGVVELICTETPDGERREGKEKTFKYMQITRSIRTKTTRLSFVSTLIVFSMMVCLCFYHVLLSLRIFNTLYGVLGCQERRLE